MDETSNRKPIAQWIARILADLDHRAFEQNWSENQFLQEIERPDSITILADSKGRCFEPEGLRGETRTESTNLKLDDASICGYLIARVYLLDDTVDIMRIAVVPERRRLGFAKKLLKQMEAITLEYLERPAYILLEVSEINSAAIHLYGSDGYRIVHHRKNYYPDGSMALIMRKSIG